MDLLDTFWDDTVAGPRPDKDGFGLLRKYDSLPIQQSVLVREGVPISRSITIVKNGLKNILTESGSEPSSPSGSSTPGSPLSPGMKKFRTRKYTGEALKRAEPRSPTVYDWVVISALDR
ncbi:hypothetical protein GIB67_009684 [Kingdonia uniflora]|uniref:Uncharacterized protein n=1 Tax=Kingdonia uniflora TaxID=39325 RepID=A0A7J7LB02_9MAGN|nr:hypothetical protein GIB67_009684 [Kingdonia uniflora]